MREFEIERAIDDLLAEMEDSGFDPSVVERLMEDAILLARERWKRQLETFVLYVCNS